MHEAERWGAGGDAFQEAQLAARAQGAVDLTEGGLACWSGTLLRTRAVTAAGNVASCCA